MESENLIEEKVDQEIKKQVGPRNRAERRAEAKKNRKVNKRKQYFIDSVKDVSTRLAYIDLIQSLRKINAEFEEKANEQEKESESV